jgi:hypothetical protein
LAIVQHLAELDSENWYWQESMAAVHAKIGDFFRNQVQAERATESYRQSIARGGADPCFRSEQAGAAICAYGCLFWAG